MIQEINGRDLTKNQRKQIVKLFPFRWTIENRKKVEKWLYKFEVDKYPPRSDEEWVNGHKFFQHPNGHFSEYAEPVEKE